jgi:signal peptidase II
LKATRIYTIALAVAVVDQLTKLFVVSRLPYGASVPLFGSVEITLVRNPGGAFGLFQTAAIPLTIISLVVVAGIVVISRRGGPLSPLVGTSLALQLGGALGNLIDRLRYGHVVDFINLQVWPIFNVADTAITIGILLLAGYLVFCGRTAPRQVGDAPLAESEPAKR